MIRVGDRVKFLNDAGGGVVTKIENDQVFVQIEDGFEIPTVISNLIIAKENQNYNSSLSEEMEDMEDEKYSDTETPSAPVAPNMEKKKEEELPVEVSEFANNFHPLLAFVIEQGELEVNDKKIEIYLINEGNYFMYYIAGLDIFQKRYPIARGELEPSIMVKIGTFSVTQLFEYTALNISLLPFNIKAFEEISPLSVSFDWTTLNLTAESQFKENEYFEDKALIIDILQFQDFRNKKELLSKKLDKLEIFEQPVKQNTIDLEEVDLHIDKILSPEEVPNLTSGQILDAQIARFNFALESALKSKTKRIVFIHGVGNGKLRYEIQKILKQKYPHLAYQDASFEEYGYGATMVILRK
jgi:hypothetical protein